ncbi:ArsR/SmtB family transcription factor [Streptomyces cinnamoneus]|uniref:Transcriptional regulator n=1 Tax=Streptomyces cinnamoneus TaxID=53446 RepID=A0A918TTH2_STRCJ|nr:winged helix-turn-helix domain-containing protein [Streptomyces cinnamoneus]GHC62271.1 transcriptional regulator [Streptomyces cinnamoneus]
MRIHFTGVDLGRIRVSAEPDLLWETLLAAHMVQTGQGPLIFGEWRNRVRSALTDPMRRLLALAPPRGYSPDFLTPPEAAEGLESGLDAMLSLPRGQLRHDLELLAPDRRDLHFVRALAAGEAAPLRALGDGITAFHDLAVRPYLGKLSEHISADRAVRSQSILHSGGEHLLATLHPAVRWNPPVLEVAIPGTTEDVYLEGRGLRLVPSFFCWRAPTVLRDPLLPPVLVYPIVHDPAWLLDVHGDRRARGEPPLAALLGRTRAEVLEATARGCTTSELARRVRIAMATASHHATVLRDAGLITTHRANGRAYHTLSFLGRELLNGRRLVAPDAAG